MPDPSHLPAVIENPSPVLDPDAVRVPTSHQLPAHRGKAARVGDHVAALSADLREWVELRIDLVKAEVAEKVDETVDGVKRKAEPVAYYAAAGFLGLYLLGFTLALVGVGVAWAVANDDGADVVRPLFWGLLAVVVLLAAVAGVLALIGKRKQEHVRAVEARLKAPEYTEAAETAPLPPTRRQLQDLEARHARQTTA